MPTGARRAASRCASPRREARGDNDPALELRIDKLTNHAPPEGIGRVAWIGRLSDRAGCSCMKRFAKKRQGAVNKTTFMCVTAGRSGTTLLAKLLALAEDICAVHEPEPAYHSVLSEVRQNPETAVSFVRDVKLPYILSRPERNYAETSFVFCEGFFEAFIVLDIPFRIIVLDRNPSDVAVSLWRIHAIPHRTADGREWLLDPVQRDVMQMPGWETMSDYQLCYWYCLEIERRKGLYIQQCRARNIPVAEVSLQQLLHWETFQELCEMCDLALPEAAKSAHHALVSRKVNTKDKFPMKVPKVPFAVQEQEVWDALGRETATLRSEISTRYRALSGLPLRSDPEGV